LPISNGASPIASALGIRLGATPRGRIHLISQPRLYPTKQDISTLPALGHFYFALTIAMECDVRNIEVTEGLVSFSCGMHLNLYTLREGGYTF
jgi:hypothetical protein